MIKGFQSQCYFCLAVKLVLVLQNSVHVDRHPAFRILHPFKKIYFLFLVLRRCHYFSLRSVVCQWNRLKESQQLKVKFSYIYIITAAKGKIFLYISRRRTGKLDVRLFLFFTSALVGVDWSTSRSWRFNPSPLHPHSRENACNHWRGGWVGPRGGLDVFGHEKISSDWDSNSVPSRL